VGQRLTQKMIFMRLTLLNLGPTSKGTKYYSFFHCEEPAELSTGLRVIQNKKGSSATPVPSFTIQFTNHLEEN